MTKKTKTIFFLSLLVVFLITAPLTVFYSLGWRFDWETKKFVQTGSFYFKVWPKTAQIYLNGNFEEKTDLFFGSVFIENLQPKNYEIEIKREGFHSWKKTLEIKKRQVTESKNIVLIPENPRFTIIAKGVKDFSFSSDEKKIILEEMGITDSESQSWTLKLFETEKNVKSHLINEQDILLTHPDLKESKEKVQLIDLQFSPDSKKILLKTEIKKEINYFLLKIDKAPAILTPLDFLDSNADKIFFNPKDPQKLFILTSQPDQESEGINELKEINLTDKKISSALIGKVVTCLIFNNNIYYLDNSGFLFKTNFSFDWQERLNIIPLSLKREAEYEIRVSGSNIFLREDNILYCLDEKGKSFQKLFEHLNNTRFSPDSKEAVYFNNYEIWVLFLEKKYEQPQKEAREKLFITRFSEKIDEVFWYTNHYLIFNSGDKIKVAETDDRDKINIVDLAEFKNPKIFWNQNEKKLYILTEETLFTSEKIAP